MIYVTVTVSGESYQSWILGKLSKSHLQINTWDILCQSGKLAWSQRKEFTLLKYLLYSVTVWWVSYQLLHILKSHLRANFSPAMVMRPVAGFAVQCWASTFSISSCLCLLLLFLCSHVSITLYLSEIVIVFCYFQLNFEVYFGMCLVLVLLPVPLWLSALPSSPSPVSSHHSSLCECCQRPPLSALLQSVGFFLFLQ